MSNTNIFVWVVLDTAYVEGVVISVHQLEEEAEAVAEKYPDWVVRGPFTLHGN